jgi:hypothetical protein
MVSSDGQMMGKGGQAMIFFSGGTLTQSYRPPAFDGTLAVSRLILSVNGIGIGVPTSEIKATGSGDVPLSAAEQTQILNDGTPFVELFDRTTGAWVRMEHMVNSTSVTVADPTRYVDPTSGGILVRFRTGDQNGIGFPFQVQLEGTVQ